MMRKVQLLILFLILFSFSSLIFAAGQKEAVKDTGKLNVFVTIAPQKYFVEKIAGDLADVNVLVSASDDPHTYQLKPSQVSALGKADLYLKVGLNYEEAFMKSLEEVLPGLKIADMSRGVTLIPFGGDPHEDDHEKNPADDHEDELADDHEDEHDHTGWDPHFWLGTTQVMQSAEIIRDVLAAELPDYRQEIFQNYNNFIAEAETMHKEIQIRLEPYEDSMFFVYHQAFGYFAHNYDLRQVAVETGGKEPSARQVEAMIRAAREEGVRVVFVQPQYSTASAQVIAKAIGGGVSSIDPLAEDWLFNMRQISIAIEQGMK